MNIIKSILGLLIFCWSSSLYGQECVSFTGPITLPDQIDTTFSFQVYNLDSLDLGTNQSICRVNLEFATQYPGDLLISLISPQGVEVVLVGSPDNSSPNTILLTTWDISFLPLDSTAVPDLGYSATWSNSQDWVGLFFGEYTGSYYPHNGAFFNYNGGSPLGEWKLRVRDGFEFHEITLISFSIEFCNPANLDCSECSASADTIIPQQIEYCENDSLAIFEFADYLSDTTFIDSLDTAFTYTAAVVANDTVVAIQTIDSTFDARDLPPGQYELYGLVYSNAYLDKVPTADSSFTIDSLRNMIDSLPRIFCGDLTRDSILLSIWALDTIDINPTLCFGDSLIVGDSTFTSSGNYSVVLTNENGCDSLVRVDLTVLGSILTIIDTTICFGDSILVHDMYFSENTNRIDTMEAAGGCDSLILLNLVVREYNFHTLDIDICQGDSFVFFEEPLSASGVYRDSTLDVHGCDSVVVLNLDVVTEFNVDTTAILCAQDSFLVGSNYYRTSGFYSDTLLSSLGCDSIVNLDLTILEPIITDVNALLCFGDSIQVGASIYGVSGFYTDTLTSVRGCDSVVNLELTVLPENGSMQSATICFGDSIASANKFYSVTGIYRDTLTDQFSCDSIVVLELIVKPPNETNLFETLCFGDSMMIGDSVYYETGQYATVLEGIDLCDSLVFLNLIISDQVVGVLDTAICQGDSILQNDQYYDQVGNYEIIFERDGLCDSTLILNLSIIEPIEHELGVILCEGETYTVGGKSYGETGVYRDTFSSSNGCDSIVILNLSFNNIFFTPLQEIICEGDSIFFNDQWRQSSGEYRDSLLTRSGCDSVLILDLVVLSLNEPVSVSEVLCFGDSLFFNEGFRSTEGQYRDTLLSTLNCDSVVILDLQILDEIQTTLPMSICLGDTLAFEGDEYSASGSYSYIHPSTSGCDSTVIIELFVDPCPLDIIFEETSPTCTTLANGSITVRVDYGVAPYDVRLYSEQGATIIGELEIPVYGAQNSFSQLDAGAYLVVVIDASGDSLANEIVLENSSPFTIDDIQVSNYSGYEISCDGNSDGSISFEIDGGTAPYNIVWQDGADGNTRSNLNAGEYQVSISDAQGCEDELVFNLNAPTPISFEIEKRDPTCTGESNGSINVINVSGGVREYRFLLDSESNATGIFENLAAGEFNLSVIDLNNCQTELEIIIQNPPIFTIDLGEDITLDNVGTVELAVTGSEDINSIIWTPSEGLSCDDCTDPIATVARTITYSAVAQNELGCEATDNITLILDIDRTVDLPAAFTPNADNVNDIFIVHGDSSIDFIANIEIFNRSGELVFTQQNFPVNDPSFGWDGKFKGDYLSTQILVYFVEVIYTDGKKKIFKGQLTLIR